MGCFGVGGPTVFSPLRSLQSLVQGEQPPGSPSSLGAPTEDDTCSRLNVWVPHKFNIPMGCCLEGDLRESIRAGCGQESRARD